MGMKAAFADEDVKVSIKLKLEAGYRSRVQK